MHRFVAALVLFAMPAMAQAQLVPRSPPGTARLPGMVEIRPSPIPATVDHDLDEAYKRIDYRVRTGELSKREARQLRRDARLTRHLAIRYAYDGLTEPERRELETRASILRGQAEAPVVRK